jgi:hypothetical protein
MSLFVVNIDYFSSLDRIGYCHNKYPPATDIMLLILNYTIVLAAS